jgi:hypothetical protein
LRKRQQWWKETDYGPAAADRELGREQFDAGAAMRFALVIRLWLWLGLFLAGREVWSMF